MSPNSRKRRSHFCKISSVWHQIVLRTITWWGGGRGDPHIYRQADTYIERKGRHNVKKNHRQKTAKTGTEDTTGTSWSSQKRRYWRHDRPLATKQNKGHSQNRSTKFFWHRGRRFECFVQLCPFSLHFVCWQIVRKQGKKSRMDLYREKLGAPTQPLDFWNQGQTKTKTLSRSVCARSRKTPSEIIAPFSLHQVNLSNKCPKITSHCLCYWNQASSIHTVSSQT